MDDMAYKHVRVITVFVVFYICCLWSMFAFGNEIKTTCRLASQILGNNQRVCVFVGANNTQYREYVPYDAGECPKEYQCPYRPNEKPFDIKSVIRSIKDQFTE